MTLPILNINSTEHRYYIELIDIHNNECTDIIQLADSDETIYLFFRFLDMLIEYYEKGYDNAIEDMEGGEFDVGV